MVTPTPSTAGMTVSPKTPSRRKHFMDLLGSIAYTEQGKNNGTVILDGVCYSGLQFCRVILSRMIELSCSQSFLDEYCLICRVPSSPGVYRRPCVSPSMLHHLFNTLNLPSDEGGLTH